MKKETIYKIADDVRSAIKGDNSNPINDIKVAVRVSQNRTPLPQNVMLFQAFATMAAIKLKPATSQVLMLLFGMSAYENYLSIDVKTIAETLDISERSVIRSLNELVDNKIILKFPHPSDKRRHDYFVNPLAAWKGNSYTRAKKIKSMIADKTQLQLFDTPEGNEHSLLQ